MDVQQRCNTVVSVSAVICNLRVVTVLNKRCAFIYCEADSGSFGFKHCDIGVSKRNVAGLINNLNPDNTCVIG